MRKNKIDNLTRFIKFRNRIIETIAERSIQSSVGNLSSYFASKFGLVGLAESLKLEVAEYNIRVLTVFLGQ
jgi:NAD(P)-dependent dehydrogenase (short-subunit alcohol dehydrogenase family)